MLDEDIQALGGDVFTAPVRPCTLRERGHVVELGLDTEWFTNIAGENELISWSTNLDNFRERFTTEPFSWEALFETAKFLCKKADINVSDLSLFNFYVYFLTAEGQWLDLTETEIFLVSSHQGSMSHKLSQSRRLQLFDVSTWFPHHSLAEVARYFGYEKMEYDVAKLTPDSVKDPLFFAYNLKDAWLTNEIGKKLRGLVLADSGTDILYTRTPASDASVEFRASYIPRELVKLDPIKTIDKTTGEILNVKKKDGTIRKRKVYRNLKQPPSIIRRDALRASMGGRKECFFQGSKDNVFDYDASSFYPSIVKQMEILPLQDDWRSTCDLNTWLNAKGGFGKVWFKFPEQVKKPSLLSHTDSKIVAGSEGITNTTTFEVRYAIEQGAEIHLFKGWYYNTGVDWLAKYEESLVDRREATDNPALQQIYKAKAVGIIGKLTQKIKDYDLNEVMKYAKETGLDPQAVYGLGGIPIKQKIKTGSLFIPEWYALILGAARANVARASDLADALQISTDGICTEQYMGTSFQVDGITYRLEGVGDYVAYRSGLYRIGEKLVYHGASKEVANKILTTYNPLAGYYSYTEKRIVALKESFTTGSRYGSTKLRKKRVSLSFDGKRRLNPDGTTEPIPNLLNRKDNLVRQLWNGSGNIQWLTELADELQEEKANA